MFINFKIIFYSIIVSFGGIKIAAFEKASLTIFHASHVSG